MKKGLKILSISLSIFLLVGCIDYHVKMQVNSDKSVDINMTYEIDMLKMVSNMSDESSFGKVIESLKESTCSSVCADDTECMDECLSSNDEQVMPSEAEIKAQLKEYVNSSEFTTEDLFSAEQKSKLESKGYKVETTMDKEKFIFTAKITQHFPNIESISSNNKNTIKLGNLLTGEENNIFFTKKQADTYEAEFLWDDTDLTENNNLNMDIDTKDFLNFTYETTLPTKPISSNATKTSSDGKTLTWELSGNNSGIKYEFSFPKNALQTDQQSKNTTNNTIDTTTILAYGLIAGGVIIGLIFTGVYLKSKKG